MLIQWEVETKRQDGSLVEGIKNMDERGGRGRSIIFLVQLATTWCQNHESAKFLCTLCCQPLAHSLPFFNLPNNMIYIFRPLKRQSSQRGHELSSAFFFFCSPSWLQRRARLNKPVLACSFSTGDTVPAVAAASGTAGLLDRLRYRLSPPGRLRDGCKDHRGVQENTTGENQWKLSIPLIS